MFGLIIQDFNHSGNFVIKFNISENPQKLKKFPLSQGFCQSWKYNSENTDLYHSFYMQALYFGESRPVAYKSWNFKDLPHCQT